MEPKLLKLQASHRSQAVLDGLEVPPVRSRAHLIMCGGFKVDDRVVKAIRGTPFYTIHRLASAKIDVNLISALLERWRQETHTFHLTVGEASITLQDVQVLLGLKVAGKVVSGHTNYNWNGVVEEAFGVTPPEGVLKGANIKITWLMEQFRVVPSDITDEQLSPYVRAYLLILFGTVLFPDKSGNDISILYLPLLMDLSSLDEYSWGSAVLATLYRNLCRASQRKKDGKVSKSIGGPLILLQLWSWERIAIGRPILGGAKFPLQHEQGVHPLGSQHQFKLDPLGCKWLKVNKTNPEGAMSLAAYRDALDLMKTDQFTWQPYSPSVLQFLPDECYCDSDDWSVIVPLICFEIVEWHRPDRVMRQFGWFQKIPEPCDNSDKLHKLDKRGGSSKSWLSVHSNYIILWNNRRLYRATGHPSNRDLEYNDDYMKWYRQNSHFIISPLPLQQSTSHNPLAASLHAYSQHVAELVVKFRDEVRLMPAETPPHYRELLTNSINDSTELLQRTGFQHLIQPTQQTSLGGGQVKLSDDSPLATFIHGRGRPRNLSPIAEEDTPQSSRGKRAKTRQGKKKT